jgi:hypothetical protein
MPLKTSIRRSRWLGKPGGENGPDDPELKSQLLFHLADCHGMKGGVYRRWDNHLEDALAMYRTGLEYEEQLNNNSYNRSNVIAHTLIHDGSALPSLLPTICKGIELVTEQVTVKGRGEEVWPHADLGLYCLLDGRWNEAVAHYKEFGAKGAGDDDYESALGVLRTLQQSLDRAGQAGSRPAQAVGQLLAQAIELLSRQRLSASSAT